MRVTKNEEIISSLFYDRFHTFEEMRRPELRHYHESSVMQEDPVGYLQVQKAFSHQRVCCGWKYRVFVHQKKPYCKYYER